MIHEITLTGYDAIPSGEYPYLTLGTEYSYGIEQIQVVVGEGWDGLTIMATFHPPHGVPVSVLVENGLVDVPWEATAASSMRYVLKGEIVFSGTADGVQRIARDLVYYVADHAPVNAPIDKIYIYTLASKPFPAGSKFELYGIKSDS